MLIIGSHVSFNKEEQMVKSIKEAISYKSNAFMFYTGAPQNTIRVPLSSKLKEEAYELLNQNNIDITNVIVHAPYIINLANPNNFDFSVSFLKQEIRRCEFLGVTKLVLHPGSHVNFGREVGLNTIVEALKLSLIDDTSVDICLETMAGKGSELGTTFEDLNYIIKNVGSDKLKLCLDTCHLNDYGYDISDFDSILDEVDSTIGIDKIAVVHINDSKNERASHKDRHENFGFGTIGFDSLINVIYNKRIEKVPKILETPWIKDENDSYPPYKFEIEEIRLKTFDKDVVNKIISYYKKD